MSTNTIEDKTNKVQPVKKNNTKKSIEKTSAISKDKHQVNIKNTESNVSQENNNSSSFINSESKDNSKLSDKSNKSMTNNHTGLENKSNECTCKNKVPSTDKLIRSGVTKMENIPIVSEADVDLQPLKYTDNDDIIYTIKTLTNSKTKKGEFKIASMAILLTYRGHRLNKEALFEHISSIMTDKEKKIEEYIIVHERYKSSLYLTHVYFKLNESFRSSNSKIFDFTDVKPNIERVLHRNESFLENVYCYLFDKDIHPYTNLSDIKIHQIKSNKEISNITSLTKKDISLLDDKETKVSNIDPKVVRNLEDTAIIRMEPWEFKPWQKFLLNVIENEVDENAFYWCWEPIGQMGKTKLTNYISTNYNNVLGIKTLDTYENLINMYLNVIKTRTINIVIFDLSKKVSNRLLNAESHGIFDFIETLKDGYINDGKINSNIIKLTPCHVIVFSNCITGIKEINSGKWKIIKILEDGEACMGSVNTSNEINYEDTYI